LISLNSARGAALRFWSAPRLPAFHPLKADPTRIAGTNSRKPPWP